jgi:hypothetical protein
VENASEKIRAASERITATRTGSGSFVAHLLIQPAKSGFPKLLRIDSSTTSFRERRFNGVGLRTRRGCYARARGDRLLVAATIA